MCCDRGLDFINLYEGEYYLMIEPNFYDRHKYEFPPVIDTEINYCPFCGAKLWLGEIK